MLVADAGKRSVAGESERRERNPRESAKRK